MRMPKPRQICIFHRQGRNHPPTLLTVTKACTLHEAIVTFAALSCYDVRELRAEFA
ncbi:hypothetical protein WYO_0148 [Methylobacterium sp. GXF4]|uniref:hypothetical protein n=1 Tax=Methylobacterium sp. GXF4 TaxID=1096546 RepID=UPI0002698C3D|nr:hypothetical protein [Methylobacterium sp. GXF4]EIZ87111.1 hypothetical protein WYO_0148 [Methylobacterium sp. GXF4]